MSGVLRATSRKGHDVAYRAHEQGTDMSYHIVPAMSVVVVAAPILLIYLGLEVQDYLVPEPVPDHNCL